MFEATSAKPVIIQGEFRDVDDCKCEMNWSVNEVSREVLR